MKPGGLAALALAAVVFLGGSVYGFRLLTASADVTTAVATCTPKTVANGEQLTPNLVTVDVYNASRTAGLANRASIDLQRRNFLAGNIANNPTEVATEDIVILAADPTDPRVRLVQAQFAGKVTVVEQALPGSDNVAVLVGRKYTDRGLKAKAPATVTLDRDISVCTPVVPVA